MKKLILFLTILTTPALQALPVGNPGDASLLCNGVFFCCDPCEDACAQTCCWTDIFNVRVGFYGDYVFNRNLEVTRVRGREVVDIVDIGRLNTNAGLLVFNFFNRADLFATFGASHLSGETTDDSLIFGVGERIKVDTDSQFSWSIGGRAAIWECGCTLFGIEGQYFRFRPHTTRLEFGDAPASYAAIDIRYSEWQVGFGVAHRINMLVPYAAVKYADCDIDVPASSLSLRAAKNWGFAIGATLIGCDVASVTVEGRYGDEKALHVNAQVRF